MWVGMSGVGDERRGDQTARAFYPRRTTKKTKGSGPLASVWTGRGEGDGTGEGQKEGDILGEDVDKSDGELEWVRLSPSCELPVTCFSRTRLFRRCVRPFARLGEWLVRWSTATGGRTGQKMRQ